MRSWLAPLLPVSLIVALACGGMGDTKTAEVVEAPAAPATPATPAVWELTRQENQDLVKAGAAQGLVVGTPVVLLGPPLAGTENRQIVGSGKVAEVWPDLARVETERVKRDAAPPTAARALLPEDQAAVDALPLVAAGKASPKAAGAAQAEFTVDQVPVDMRSGSPDAREEALVRYEGDPTQTNAIAWVMKNDNDSNVRFKAWRVLRARWRKGTGSAAEHEAAAVWAAANGNEDMRTEALAAIGERGRSLNAPAKHLADASQAVRVAAANAVFDIGSRTGKRAEAKKLLQDRLAIESVSSVRKKLDGWVDDL